MTLPKRSPALLSLLPFVLVLGTALLDIAHAHAQDAASADVSDEPASNEEDAPSIAEPPPPRRDEATYARFELTMGFVGAYARYASVGFTGAPSLPAGALDSGPMAGLAMAGVRYDARLVVSCVRMTIGGDLTWGLFDGSASRSIDAAGMTTTLAERSVFDGALRFGLGLEVSVDGVRLFADVLGVVHFVQLGIETQGVASTQHATVFAPGLRIGARLPIAEAFFVQLSADASPFGPFWLGGDLSVGGAFE